MKITINSIEAQLTDTSTFEKSEFLINRWVVKYEVVIDHEHTVEGWLAWNGLPDTYKIIKYITWFYGKRNTTTPQQA